MKANELKDRTAEELVALEKELNRQLFDHQFKNFTNRLDDTSQLRKTRRDVARVKTALRQKQSQKPAAPTAATKLAPQRRTRRHEDGQASTERQEEGSR